MQPTLCRQKKILITGGAGFIGTALCKRLSQHNQLLVFDNKRRFTLAYFQKDLNQKNINFIEGDILDRETLKKEVLNFKPQIVIHLAAMAGVSSYYQEPLKTMEVNAIGTYNLLQIIKDLKLEQFIYFSSSEVYGHLAVGATKEDGMTGQGSLDQLRWTYSISKLAGEALTFAFAHQYKIPITSIRPFNVYGPGQLGEGAIAIFAPLALKNEPIKITGDGNQIRTWCYIDDFVDAVLLILESKKALGQIFNIGNPSGVLTIAVLAQRIIFLSHSESNLKFVPHIGEDINLRIPNIQKAKDLLGFNPKISLEEGLKQTIKWYKQLK